MGSIGLLAALPAEFGPLLRKVGRTERIKVGAFAGYRFRVAGQDCWLVASGMGVRHAEEATRALLAVVRPQALICFGVAGTAAGAPPDDLRVGDVLMGKGVCELDRGRPGAVLPLVAWPAAAREAAAQALGVRGARLWAGTIITTPGPNTLRSLPEGMEHPVVEMETAGVWRGRGGAHPAPMSGGAAEAEIPLFGLRAISDLGDAPLPFGVEEFTDADLNPRLARVLGTFLRRPRIIPAYLRMAWGARLASENLGVALVAAVGQMTGAV